MLISKENFHFDRFWKWFYLHFTAISVNLVALALGTIFSWASPVIPKLNGSEDLNNSPLLEPTTRSEEMWLISISLVSACLGTFFSILTTKKMGRKRLIVLATTPCIVGYLILILCSDVDAFIFGRFLCGLTLGAEVAIIPLFAAEISGKTNRGAIGCYFPLFLSLGQLYVYALGPVTTFMTLNIFALLIPVLAVLLIGFFVEESPFYYVERGDMAEAERVLRKYRCEISDDQIGDELDDIYKTISNEDGFKFKEFLAVGALRKSLIISLSLVTFQQFSGISIVASSMELIFESTGISISSKMSSIYIGIIQLATNLLLPFVIDRWGRKILLVISQLLLALTLTSLGLFFYLKINEYDVSQIFWLPLFSLAAYIIFFTTGCGSVIFVLIGEIFPEKAKTFTSTITSFTMFFVGTCVVLVFPLLVQAFNIAYAFWIFAFLSGVGSFTFLITLPETKGKTFLEIQDILGR